MVNAEKVARHDAGENSFQFVLSLDQVVDLAPCNGTSAEPMKLDEHLLPAKCGEVDRLATQ